NDAPLIGYGSGVSASRPDEPSAIRHSPGRVVAYAELGPKGRSSELTASFPPLRLTSAFFRLPVARDLLFLVTPGSARQGPGSTGLPSHLQGRTRWRSDQPRVGGTSRRHPTEGRGRV